MRAGQRHLTPYQKPPRQPGHLPERSTVPSSLQPLTCDRDSGRSMAFWACPRGRAVTSCALSAMRTSFVEVGSTPAHTREINTVHSALHGPETTGRHRRVETPPALAETGRHRAIAAPPPPTPGSSEPVRRRHAADTAPLTHPDARRRTRIGSRALQCGLASAGLLAVAVAPVLARSSHDLGLRDAVAAAFAAQPDNTSDEENRGSVLAGSGTTGRTPARPAGSSSALPTATASITITSPGR